MSFNNAIKGLIQLFEFVIRAFHAFYYRQPWPEGMNWFVEDTSRWKT